MSLWKGILTIISDNIDSLLALHNVPAANSILNSVMRDVLGNKDDARSSTGSLVAIAKEIEQEAYETEHHLHNREIWFGNGAVEDSLTPYTIISGNNDFGDEVLIFDASDTPVIAGKTKYDPHKIEVTGVDTSSPYYLRMIWGAGTVGDAETAKQYSTFPVTPSGIGSNVSGAPIEIIMNRVNSGVDKIWLKAKNVTDDAEIYVIAGIHEYDR